VLIVVAMFVRGWIIAHEAGDIQRRWRYFVDAVQRNPAVLDSAAVASE